MGLIVNPLMVVKVRRNTSSSSEESSKSFHLSAKEYVESLHQNSKTTLLYGKNNVYVQPKEDVESLAGYLSLHQSAGGLTVMWTPNQLMNGCIKDEEEDVDRSLYWDYALTVYLDEIVYIHCHQQPDCGGTIVLVGQDGVQRPPIHFPKGGHLLAFLSCLETGLLPHGQLDPPLWSQRGKVFPKLKRKGSRLSNIVQSDRGGSTGSSSSTSSTDDDEATDYVFRIITTFRPDIIPPEMMDPKAKIKGDNFSWASKIPRLPSPMIQTVQTYARSQEIQNNTCLKTGANHRATIKQLCDTMRKQIISRAFYGWLAHCRHLKTVRTHLSGLVLHKIVPADKPYDGSCGLSEQKWNDLQKDGTITDEQEIHRLVYYGGVQHEIRKQVWPYLLGHYAFSSTPEDRVKVDKQMRWLYEKTMSEWLAVEAIVRQREKEIMAANLQKMSSESTDGQIPLVRKDSSLSNDVFESQSFDEWEDFSHPETVPEESSATGTTCTPTPDRKQSMDLPLQDQVIDKMKQTKEFLLEKRDYVISSFSDSPDDGLGDSIARQSSQERSKLDSAGDSEGTDISKLDRDGSIDRSYVTPKLSCSADSAEADEEDGGESDDEAEDDDDEEEDKEDDDDSRRESLLTVESAKTIEGDSDHMRKLSTSRESLISPASPASHGGVYSPAMLDSVALNLHRIDKDVQRCDRNYWYFTIPNLDKLRNVMCTYVWEHLDIGYVQGMCDLVAPLLVIFDDELVYDDVFSVWETIWAAKYISSPHFVLFMSLALVEFYRDIILDNNMDFTDIIKFFNEMAERHKAKQILKLARDLVLKLQTLIDNK
ncbi:Hypothetical predicted protein [Mytilus galloprovincialis]|uniref:Rab-GAP TBC domain-containing protein n=1 Tax=Mytilus galloprovincialis TaxID=29158 RepID=A0A8B6H3F0_MYTGA|nr:Hypothetical predicted protein [Mytilus galloprovincialis]